MSFFGPRPSFFPSFRLVAVLSRSVVALGALSLSVGIAHATAVPVISNPTPVSFGSQAVGSAQAQTTVTFNVTGGGTLSTTPLVLTTGQANLDYTVGTGSTCTGTVSVGTCTVNVIFTPKAPGQRFGAVVLQAGGSTVATALLYGTGTGPAVVFPVNTAITTLGSGFSNPFGVAVDGAGNVYVSDSGNNAVKEILAVGGSIPASNPTINTLGPSGTFSQPFGVAVDGAGNVYVADSGHNAVKEIVAVGGSIPAGNPTINTLGSGFSGPFGVAVDGAGNVYVADTNNRAVKEIVAVGGSIPASNPTITTLGSGFFLPYGVAVDGSGDVFVADEGHNAVKEIVAVGGSIPAGNPTINTLGSGFSGPFGVAVDGAGNVYVADTGHYSVKEIVAVGGSIPASNPTINTFLSGFARTYGVAVDGAGNVYVADFGDTVVKEIPLATPPSVTFASTSVGNTSNDSPQTLTLQNIGNTSLTFPIPTSGTNPAISSNYTLSGSGTCPQLTTSTSAAQTLAPGTCTAVVSFTPFMPSTAAGSLVFTDNSLNTTSTQSVTLTGTATGATGTTAQTITFPQPTTPAQAGTTATLTASSSSGLAIIYSVVSGPATLSGSTVTYTGAGTVVLEADQYGNNTYSAATAVQRTVTVQAGVGTTGPTQTATVTITTAGTLNTISVLTTGKPNLDFTFASGGTCTVGTAYAANATCTVNYTFTPQYPGLRRGAVTLLNSSGTILATTYISGTGTGPQALYTLPTQSTYATISGSLAGGAFDGNGYLYAAGNAGVVRVPVGGGTPTTINTSAGANAVAIDGAGNLFYTYNNTLYEITAYTLANGTPPFTGTSVATLSASDNCLLIDSAGNIYYSNETSNTGIITKLAAGTFTSSTFATIGTRTIGLAGDASGNIYAAGFGNNSIYKIASGSSTATQIISTNLNDPFGIAVDAAGDIFVTNYGSGTVYRFTAGTYAASLIYTSASNVSFLVSDASGNLYNGSNGGNVYRLLRTAGVPIAFASTAVGASSSATSIAIENDGNASLAIASVTASTASFTGALGTCTSTLAAAAACSPTFSFIPQTSGSLSANGIVTDNSLNVSGSTQTVALSGTGTIGTKTITFPQPTTPVVAGTSATLTASTSNGDPVVFTITAGTATISGTTTTSGTTTATIVYTNSGSVTIAANSAATANYAAATTVSDTVTVTAAPASSTAPTTAVGTTSATQTAEVTFTTAGTPGTISVVTQGASGLDFAFVSGGTCSTSTAYTLGQSCTVQYTFTPSATGPRYGAVVLSSGATVLGTSYLGGVGTGPVAGFTQSSFSGAADGVGGNVQYPALVLGGTSPNPTGSGNVLYIPNNSNVLYKDTVGTGTTTFYGGAGTARYRGAAVDGAGNVYVSDVISNNVFKLSSSGTLLATWPVSGVSLSSPWGMVFGTDGTLYVANPGANDIVAITPAGVASVVTVSGYSFTAYSLAIDGSNNLYIPDNANSRILKVPGNSGAGGAAALVSVTGTAISGPGGVAIDSAGELYVTENNSTVLRISAAGVSAAVPETGLSSSAGVVTDNRGHIYVTDAAVASLFTLTLASPPALSFGSVAVGSSSTAQAVTLLNSGNASLSLASVTASTANFTGALGTCGATLASGISCAPSFAFTPQSATALTGNGIVTDNSLNVSGSTQTVALSGTGTPAPTITSYTPNPVPTGGGITVTAAGTTLSGTTGACIFQSGYLLDCDSASNVTATSFTFVTSPSIGAGTYCLRVGSSTGTPCISYTVAVTATFGTMSFSPAATVAHGSSQAITISDTVTYGGARPTGAVTFVLNSVTYTATCTTAGSPETCTATVPAATIAALPGNTYTVTAALATDSNYSAATGSGTFTVQAIPLAVTSISPASGPVSGGTSVTIAGAGFTGVTGVSFGGAAATGVVFNSDSSITATSPALAGTNAVVDVRVTAGAGTTATSSADQFTYIVPASFTLPTTAVGVSSGTQTAYVTFTTAGTLGTINVLTQGAVNKDYAFVSGGSCATGAAYTVGQVCTVNYTFTPSRPGQRLGAVSLTSSTSTVLGTAFVTGAGTGPLATFPGSTAISSPGSTSGAFSNPHGMAVDGVGDVFVADPNNNAVYEIVAVNGVVTSSSTVNTVGSGFSGPYGVAVDGSGDVFVADLYNSAVYEIVAVNGVVTSSSTVNTVGSGFANPAGVAVDGSGDVFVADIGHSAVKEIVAVNGMVTSSSTVNTVGSRFSVPTGMAVDGAGNVYVADYGQNAVEEIVAVNGVVTSSSTVNTVGSGFNSPFGVAVDGSGDVFVADEGNSAVKEIVAVNGMVTSSSTVNTVGGGFGSTFGVAVDGSGHVLVADTGHSAVKEVDLTAAPSLAFATTSAGATSSDSPQSVTLQNEGNAPLTFASVATGTTNFTVSGAGTCSTVTPLPESGVCTVAASFTPMQAGPLTDTLTLTDNSLNVTGSTQTVALSGTGTAGTATFGTMSFSPASTVAQGTSQVINISDTVTYGGPRPTGAVTFVLNSVTYTATCTTAGSPETCTATVPAATIAALPGNTYTVTAALATDSYYSAATGTSGTFVVQTVPVITWYPSSFSGYQGTALSAGVLDATTATTNGTFAYTATNSSNVTVTVTAASTLALGTYTLTATFTPSNPGAYATATATNLFTVRKQSIFVVNSGGSLTSVFEGGASQSSAVSGGGTGAAVDANGLLWSIATGGTSVTLFTDVGTLSTTFSTGSTSAATALAIDGNDVTWLALSNGTVTALTNGGAAALTTPVDPGDATAAAGSITVDAAGSLWISNPGTNTVTEVIGSAAPIATPVQSQVISSKTGAKP